MSQRTIKITIICEPKVKKEIETALANSGVQFTKEEIKEPENYLFYIPDAIWCLSIALHILEAKKTL